MQPLPGNANTHAVEASLHQGVTQRTGATFATRQTYMYKKAQPPDNTRSVQVGAFPGVPRQRHGLLPQT